MDELVTGLDKLGYDIRIEGGCMRCGMGLPCGQLLGAGGCWWVLDKLGCDIRIEGGCTHCGVCGY